jgi:hypothetical protein
LVESEREDHQHPRRVSVGVAEVLDQFVVGHVRFGQHHRVAAVPRQRLAQLVEEPICRSLGGPALFGFHEERRRVESETRHAEALPEQRDLADLFADQWVVGVEVGLETVEAVAVPGLGPLVVSPRLVLDAGKHGALEPVGWLRV